MTGYFKALLTDEIKKWEENNIISSETTQKIFDYYKQIDEKQREAAELKLQEEKKRSQERMKKLPVIISVIAGLLIVGGIISLIAFNWNLISRGVKTCGAFLLSVIPAFIFMGLNLSKKQIEIKTKECISTIWVLLCGVSMEFISQIYKLPFTADVILICWIVTSILILYYTESFFVFYIDCIILISTVFISQFYDKTNAVYFYPVIAALIPFARKNKINCYILLGIFGFLLGFVLEKCVPGLWILCYLYAAIILFIYAVHKNNFILKCITGGAFVILAILFAIPSRWQNIGWNYYRMDESHDIIGGIVDYVVCGALFIGAIVSWILSVNKSKKIKLEHSVILSGLSCFVFFILCSINKDFYQYSTLFIFYLTLVYFIIGVLFYKSDFALFVLLPVMIFGACSDLVLPVVLLLNLTILLYAAVEYRCCKFGAKNKQLHQILIIVLVAIFMSFGLLETTSIYDTKLIADNMPYILSCNSIVVFTSVLLVVYAFIKQNKINLKFMAEVLIPIIAVFVLYALNQIINDDRIKCLFIEISMILGFYSFVMISKKKQYYLSGFLLLAFIFTIVGFVYYGFNSPLDFVMAYFLSICYAAYFYLRKFFDKISDDEIRYYNLPVYLFMILAFIFLFDTKIEPYNVYRPAYEYIQFIFCLCFLIFVCLINPLINQIKNKEMPKIGMLFLAVVFILIFIILYSTRITQTSGRGFKIAEYAILIFGIFVFSVQEFIEGFNNKSLKHMNFYTVYFLISFLTAFFIQPTSLIARGMMFIVCGIIMLIMNVYFSKKLQVKGE